MSFDPAWLALREPADHTARDEGLLAALGTALGDREEAAVTDLGCGTGSNLRALWRVLPRRQRWRLVDHDPVLLGEARRRLAAWADAAEPAGEALSLAKEDRRLHVAFVAADLANDPDGPLGEAPDLVTAAALFDLVSASWILGFTAAVARRGSLFYTALTYDGAERWTPAHPADAAVHAAFLAHQARDKGFGASAGPGATDALAGAFAAQGYRVATAPSPWRLGPESAALVAELARGIAAAAVEAGLDPVTAERWRAARGQGTACLVGHQDLLAVPA